VASLQRIFVVSTAASPDELRRLRRDLGRQRLVLVAPTSEAKAVAVQLGGEAQPEMLLAPVRFPAADRGHALDTLVRRHALADRFADVVAVTDPASVILLLRVMAPDQLAAGGAVTQVGLPRAPRPVPLVHAGVVGAVLGVLAVLLETVVPLLALPALAAAAGLVLALVPAWRHLGITLLLAAGAAVVVLITIIASSQRFPA